MPRIAVDRDPFVKDLVAETRSAADFRINAAALIGVAGVECETEIPDKIGNGLRFEDHCVNARIDRPGIPAFEGLSDRLTCDAIGIELRNVVVAAKKVARARAVRRSRSNRKADVRRSFKVEVAVLRRRAAGLGTCGVKAGSDHLVLFHLDRISLTCFARSMSERFAVDST